MSGTLSAGDELVDGLISDRLSNFYQCEEKGDSAVVL